MPCFGDRKINLPIYVAGLITLSYKGGVVN